MVIPPDRAALHRHVESTYPEEGCGVIFHHPGTGAFRIEPLTNVYEQFKAKAPERYPRTNRTAYLFHPMHFHRACEAAEANGEVLSCVFHSHCDVGAYFSEEDQRQAAPDGQPLLPGVSYLVVAVDQGRVTHEKLFAFDGGQFPERSLR